jgi:hypothetical protein
METGTAIFQAATTGEVKTIQGKTPSHVSLRRGWRERLCDTKTGRKYI